MDINDISSIVSLIISAIAVLASGFAIKKVFWEGKKEEASTAEQYEGIAERTTRRLDEQMEKYDILQSEVTEIRSTLKLCIVLLEDYAKGTDLLVLQLETNKIMPAWKPDKEKENNLFARIKSAR